MMDAAGIRRRAYAGQTPRTVEHEALRNLARPVSIPAEADPDLAHETTEIASRLRPVLASQLPASDMQLRDQTFWRNDRLVSIPSAHPVAIGHFLNDLPLKSAHLNAYPAKTLAEAFRGDPTARAELLQHINASSRLMGWNAVEVRVGDTSSRRQMPSVEVLFQRCAVGFTEATHDLDPAFAAVAKRVPEAVGKALLGAIEQGANPYPGVATHEGQKINVARVSVVDLLKGAAPNFIGWKDLHAALQGDPDSCTRLLEHINSEFLDDARERYYERLATPGSGAELVYDPLVAVKLEATTSKVGTRERELYLTVTDPRDAQPLPGGRHEF